MPDTLRILVLAYIPIVDEVGRASCWYAKSNMLSSLQLLTDNTAPPDDRNPTYPPFYSIAHGQIDGSGDATLHVGEVQLTAIGPRTRCKTRRVAEFCHLPTGVRDGTASKGS